MKIRHYYFFGKSFCGIGRKLEKDKYYVTCKRCLKMLEDVANMYGVFLKDTKYPNK